MPKKKTTETIYNIPDEIAEAFMKLSQREKIADFVIANSLFLRPVKWAANLKLKIQRERNKVWDSIYEIWPKLRHESISVNHQTKTLTIIWKK